MRLTRQNGGVGRERMVAVCVAWLVVLAAVIVPGGARADGADVSYPECGATGYPVDQGFGVVGVNGGRPGDVNRCLASELSWALGSSGFDFAFAPSASLYINTADPGPGTRTVPVASWPHAGRSTHGDCRGEWSHACAYLYGMQHAAAAFRIVARIAGGAAAVWPWWLDVERANSWAKLGTRRYGQLNVAAIRGFVDGLRAAGVQSAIGIYSTPADWVAITGMSPARSKSYFPGDPDWVGGATSKRTALQKCRSSFSGGRVLMTQYVVGMFDIDVRCL